MTLRALIFSSLFTGPWASAQYQAPESVEYDATGDRYLVSNLQSASIRARAQDGTVSLFAGPLSDAPYGLEILDGVVYACMGNGVKGYDLINAQEVFSLSLGAQFPNGITTDGSMLYITDFHTSARRIYKVDPQTGTFSTLVNNTGGQPNGIVWDPLGERLVVAFWGSGAPLKAYDRMTGVETTVVANTGLGNIDGITIDCDGNFLVASWTPPAITRFEPTFTQPGASLNVPGLSNPADIDFDTVHERVCIPNSGNNTVVLHAVTCLTNGVREDVQGAMRIVPQPVQDGFKLHGMVVQEHFQLRRLDGSLVMEGVLHPGEEVDLTAVAAGAYALVLPGRGSAFRIIKR